MCNVKLACEEQNDGSTGKGPVDWVAHYANHRIFCIKEWKKDNLTHGLLSEFGPAPGSGFANVWDCYHVLTRIGSSRAWIVLQCFSTLSRLLSMPLPNGERDVAAR